MMLMAEVALQGGWQSNILQTLAEAIAKSVVDGRAAATRVCSDSTYPIKRDSLNSWPSSMLPTWVKLPKVRLCRAYGKATFAVLSQRCYHR